MYAEVFDGAGALDKLEGFASFNGADFYGLPRNTGTITLAAKAGRRPTALPTARRSSSRCVPATHCRGAWWTQD
jgi:dihydroorotase